MKTKFEASIGPPTQRKAKQTDPTRQEIERSDYPAKAKESREIESSATTPKEIRNLTASFAEASFIFFLSSSGISYLRRSEGLKTSPEENIA